MALPTIRSVGANAVGTTSATPGEPSGAAEGDLLVCIIASAGAAGEPTMSADWTKIRTVKNGTALTDSMLTVFRAIRGASAPSYAVSNTTNHVSARVLAITAGSFDPTTPIHVESGGNVQGSTQSVSISGLTTTMDDCLILSISAASLPDANSTSQYGSWANAALANGAEQTDNNTNQGNGGGHGTWSGEKASQGVVGPTTATKASAALLANLMIAIAPAAAAPIEGSAVQTLPSLTQAAGGDLTVDGAVVATLPALTQSVAGAVETVSGAAAQALPEFVQTLAGTLAVAGTAAGTLGELSSAAVGTLSLSGDAAQALPALGQSASALATVDGDAMLSLPGLAQAAVGSVGSAAVSGAVAQDLPALVQAGAGDLGVTGDATSGLPVLGQSAAGAVVVMGEGGGVLGALASAAGGELTVMGEGPQNLPALEQVLAGAVPVVGAFASVLPALEQSAFAPETAPPAPSGGGGAAGSWRPSREQDDEDAATAILLAEI